MIKSVYQLFDDVAAIKPAQKKIAALRELSKWKTAERILQYTYDPKIEFRLPDSPPPFTPYDGLDAEGALHTEYRRLAIFLKDNPKYGHVSQSKIEQLFITILEGIDPKDAELLVAMIQKKPYKGISRTVVKKAFPEWFE